MRKFGRHRGLLAGVILAACACTGSLAQEQEAEAEPEAPFEWKATGERVEDFKVEFIPHYKVDRSTPKALVETYAAYGDERASTQKSSEEVSAKWKAAVLKSLEKYEQELLTGEAFEALHADENSEEKEQSYSRKPHPMKVTGQSKDDNGAHWVEATQTVDKREKDWETGEWKESIEEHKLRFACVKDDDDQWSIDAVEQWDKDWENMDEDGNVPMAWIEEATPVTAAMYSRKQAESLGEVPPVKQSTPEEAALSLFDSLLKRRRKFENSLVENENGLAPWFELLTGLFTKDYVARQEKKFEDWNDEEETVREVESVTEKEGVTVVKFKAQGEWQGSVEIHLKQIEKVWKIHKTGYYKLHFNDEGEEVWEFVEEPDVYALMYR